MNYIEQLQFNQAREQYWTEYANTKSKEWRSQFIDKCIQKYESEEYRESEYNKGFEPRTPLYDLILIYGEKFGIKHNTDDTNFPTNSYLIDNMYLVEIMYGQGTVITVRKV